MTKFDVVVTRIAYAHRTITVEAKNVKEAKKKAIEEAGDYEFSEKSADYEVEFVSVQE